VYNIFWPGPGETEPRKKLSIFRYIDDFDWILISSSYPDEENTTLVEIGVIVFSSLILLIIILSVVTYISGSRIIKPLKELMERLRDGATGNYSLHLPVLSDDELGELAAHFNTFMEQLKIHRENLFSARNYLGNIINSLPSILSAVDEEGNIKLWNKGAELFTGVAAEDAESGNIYRQFPFLADFKGKIDETITAKSITEFHLRAKSVNNDNRELRISVYPFSDEEMNIAVIRMDDITEDVKKDSQLIQAQKMEIVGNLAGGLAHDFNNVLAGIIGTVSLIKSRSSLNMDEEKNARFLNIIETSAKRAAEIVDQLLALSRKNEPSMEPVDLNNSLENVMTICRNSLDKSIELLPEYYRGSAVVSGSAAQIEQVILNLCVNAAHAMTIMRGDDEPRGGKLSAVISKLKADRLLSAGHPGMIENSDYLVLKVSDTGVGIGREYQKHIFDPFFTTKSKENGTGLGLSMVYNIIKSHGGYIDLYSEPGRGTTFTVYLPAVSGEAMSADVSTVDIDSLIGEGEILIIDDEETVRDMVRGILEEAVILFTLLLTAKRGLNFSAQIKEKSNL
jgi:PAS domain S-box-containing protein